MRTPVGLILCGGKSSRLGFDKMTILREDLPLFRFWEKAVSPFCERIFFSINNTQQGKYGLNHEIVDLAPERGPLQGIYSAMQSFPDDNFLVISCELVKTSPKAIDELLLNHTEDNFEAVAYKNPASKKTYPFFTIYKSGILHKMERELLYGKGSPTQLLESLNTKIINRDIDFSGINTPEDYEKYKMGLAF